MDAPLLLLFTGFTTVNHSVPSLLGWNDITITRHNNTSKPVKSVIFIVLFTVNTTKDLEKVQSVFDKQRLNFEHHSVCNKVPWQCVASCFLSVRHLVPLCHFSARRNRKRFHVSH